jgi:oxygen-independent coproporphyrinogen-3 oxidase
MEKGRDLDEQHHHQHASRRLADLQHLQAMGLIPRTGRFFPAGIHYPPITMYPDDTPEHFLADYRPPETEEFVLYVHIPYCARRCVFCHYPVVTGRSEDEMVEYVDLLGQELQLWKQQIGVSQLKARSVLIAGGTPSFLSPRTFRRFHDVFAEHVDMSGCTQVTYDVHPEDLLGPDGADRIKMMRDFGSDRITMGLQSLDDEILKAMNRGHTAKEAYAAIDALHAGGIDDVCIEFIFGYPDVPYERWMDTVRKAIATDVQEIQLYRLKIEAYGDSPGPVERLWENHPERFPTPEQSVVQKQAAIDLLAAHGYHENLTRVFARKPSSISHYATDQCCQLLDCIGIGQSAFSSLHDRFSINTPDLGQWFDRVKSGRLPLTRGLVRTLDHDLRWNVVLPLKNSFVSKALYHQRTGHDVAQVFRRQLDGLQAHGLLIEDDERIQLTPLGRFFADEVCTQFHHPDFIPWPRDHYADGPLFLAQADLGVQGKVSRPSPEATACPMRAPDRPWPWTSSRHLQRAAH